MADNIITPHFRAGFNSVFKPSKPKNAKPDQEPKYSIQAFFPPTTDLSEMKREAQKAAEEKWGKDIPKNLRSPFRKNGDLDKPVDGIPEDWILMTFSAPEKSRPGLVDAKRNDIIDEVEVYSGAWFRAQVRAFGYDNVGNKGVSFGLQNLQKIKDDEPIGAGRTPANKAFDAVETAGSGDAGPLFD